MLAIAALDLALAQGGAPVVQPGVTIRSTTTLVQVNVVARDAQGRPVDGLAKEDFEILHNGAQSGSGSSRKVEFDLTDGRYTAAQRDGLRFSKSIEIPRDAQSLRVLVRINASGEIGTLTIPLDKIAN